VLATQSLAAPPAAGRRPPERRVLAVVRWPVGGIRTYLLYHYPHLAAAGYRFTFLGPADASFRALAEEVRGWDGAEVVEAPVRGPRWRLWRTMRSLLHRQRFDLIHSHGLTAAAQAVVGGLGWSVPHVVHSHDVFLPRQAAGLAGRARLLLLGRLLRRADAIVSVSADAQANLLEYLPGLARGRCRLVPILNGIDTARFAEGGRGADGLRRRLGVGPEVFLIGFLGRFMEQKGFLPLLEALKRLAARGADRPFRLVAVGSGDYEREYRAEVGRRGLAGHVSFLDFVPDTAPVLRQLDLLVMPSLWDACGLLAMEAMAAGTPVLGSDCPGLREVLRGTPSLVAPPGDAAAWCEALARAIAAPWTEASRAFVPEARRRFDARRSAGELLRLFTDLCGLPLSGRRTTQALSAGDGTPHRVAGAPGL
jgi:glycosyltransferase involved in cell wall biosynthesis